MLTMTDSILYCFVSHNACFEQDLARISNTCISHNIRDYLVVCGGAKQDQLIGHKLQLACNDRYEDLPEKIHRMFKFVSTNLPYYRTYAKLDRTTKICKAVDFEILAHYSGSLVNYNPGDRQWHFGKCSPGSSWNTKPYQGYYVPWCLGGSAYFLSKMAATIVGQNAPNPLEEIYEDLYVAKTLLRHSVIKATQFPNLYGYMLDPDPS